MSGTLFSHFFFFNITHLCIYIFIHLHRKKNHISRFLACVITCKLFVRFTWNLTQIFYRVWGRPKRSVSSSESSQMPTRITRPSRWRHLALEDNIYLEINFGFFFFFIVLLSFRNFWIHLNHCDISFRVRIQNKRQ